MTQLKITKKEEPVTQNGGIRLSHENLRKLLGNIRKTFLNYCVYLYEYKDGNDLP